MIEKMEALNGKWLYKDEADGSRIFAKVVYPANDAEVLRWYECTNKEKEQWEQEHKPTEENE